MPHEFEDGFFVGRPAWHGLGTVLDAAPSIEAALQLAGLDWEVEERRLWVNHGPGMRQVETGHKALVRTSDRRVLGVVGAKYTPLQNRKAFEPFQPLVEAGLVALEAAGSLRQGQRVWILGRLQGAEAEVVPGDPVKGYLLFYNGHDGTLAASYQRTATRVVCMNTLSMAVARGEAGDEYRVQFRHGATITARVDTLTQELRRASEQFTDTVRTYRRLAAARCPDPEKYFRTVLRVSTNGTGTNGADGDGAAGLTGLLSGVAEAEEVSGRARGKRQLARLLELYETQPGAGFAPGSLWQAYSAVSYWIDHDRGRSAPTRLNSSWFGAGRALRDRAFEVALLGAEDGREVSR